MPVNPKSDTTPGPRITALSKFCFDHLIPRPNKKREQLPPFALDELK
jgi:hypothetical protein